MENNENLVTNVAENTENTAEQIPAKTYTQEEVDAIVGKAKARAKANAKKEYDRQYGSLVETLKAGTGKESVEELDETFTKFYQSKGIKIEKPQEYTGKDLDVLAGAEADEIIRGGFEEAVEEADRLKELGADRMTAREKAVFQKLAKYIQDTEQGRELSKIGVTEDVYNSKEFKEFASMFKESTPISKIYENFTKTQPKKEFKTMGSMKNSDSADNGIKDFYTMEEAKRFTTKDFEKNPKLFEKVVESSHKW